MRMKQMKKLMLLVIAVSIMAGCNIMTAYAAKKPAKVKVTSIEQTQNKAAAISWKKVSGAKGYQVSYRVTGGKWEKKDTKKRRLVIKKLKANKTYEFRVRAYKKNGKKKIYGKYSAVGKIKIRKKLKTNSYTGLANGWYMLESRNSGSRVLDIHDWGEGNGANLETYQKNNTTNQRFYLQYNTGGYYTIRAMHSGRYLHVRDGAQITNVHQWDGGSHKNAHWYLESAGNGYYYLRNAGNRGYLDNNGGSTRLGNNVGTYYYNGTYAQQWKFIATSPTANVRREISDGWYMLESGNSSSRVLDIHDWGEGNGANLETYQKNNTTNQRFYLKYYSGGYYTIKVMHSGRFLHVKDNNSLTVNVHQWEGEGHTNAHWIVEPAGGGYYYLRNRSTGGYLDNNGGSTSLGNNVGTYPYNRSWAQKWRFIPTSPTADASRQISDGWYMVESANNGSRVLDIHDNGQNNGANLEIYNKNNTSNQRFYLQYYSGGYYTIRAEHSGKYIHVQNDASMTSNVHQWEGNSHANAHWIMEPAGNGYYYLRNQSTNAYLDNNGGSSNPGNNVGTYPYNRSDAQKWKFIVPSDNNQNTGSFTKYNLTDTQLKKIARLCYQEQGSVAGAKAEASLMANQLETSASRQRKYGTGADGLYNWVRNGGWFARAAYWMDNGSASNAIIEGVRDVLINGNRTLPQFVDEHDCLSDIKSISTGSVKNKNDYISGKTIVKNRYGSTWTFWCFPASGSDPFGYTDAAYNYVTGR